MIAEAGHFALILALVLSLVQLSVPVWGLRRGDAALISVGPMTAIAQFAFVAASFAALTYCYVASIASRRCGAITRARCSCGC
jgi:cytochrome c-type biogenesis protein CcmF